MKRGRAVGERFDAAVEVFVRGFCAGRSRTHPYEIHRLEDLWVLRDAPRRNPRDLRVEEWVVAGVEPRRVNALARRKAQGRYFVSAFSLDHDSGECLRDEYKSLGYRLLRTEPLFIHDLRRIPRCTSPARIERVTTPARAAELGQVTRTRPIPYEQLTDDAPFRQYVALRDEAIVGWVRSVDAGLGAWVSNMHVLPAHRRRGIGRALLSRLLRDDREQGFASSVLLASHSGALLYPHLGYQQIGLLWLLAPRKR
jgi:GNAT superfamily N-acetyltransferase